MGFVYTKQDEKVVVTLLRVLTVFLGVCIVTKVWTSVATVRAAKRVAEAAVRSSMAALPAGVEDPGGPVGAESQRQGNLLWPELPKLNPIVEVTGILGSEAFINGRWCQVGDRIGEACVLAVEATCVKVLWQGQTLVYAPVDSGKPPSLDDPSAGKQYVSWAGPKPVERRGRQTDPSATPRAETTSRSEARTFFSRPPSSPDRTVFPPGGGRPPAVPPPESKAADRLRQMAEVGPVPPQNPKPFFRTP